MPRIRTLVPVVLTLALMLGGCGDDSEPTGASPPSEGPTAGASSSDSPTTEPSSEGSPSAEASSGDSTPADEPGVVVEVTLDGDRVSPNGERIKVGVGEPVLLRIASDRPGELHVHSTPEREVGFGAGASRHELVIDSPGLVEVEEHDSGKILLQLVVS